MKNVLKSVGIAIFVLSLTVCNKNKELKPPKKSPCACYDFKVDMENVKIGLLDSKHNIRK